MRGLMLAAALPSAFALPTAASAIGAPAAQTGALSGTCASLTRTYEGVSMDLASNFADSVGDNSAPRATLRAMEDANSLATAKIALDLMRDNHCPVPKSVPSMASYISQALTCSADRTKTPAATAPASCDKANWKPAIN